MGTVRNQKRDVENRPFDLEAFLGLRCILRQ